VALGLILFVAAIAMASWWFVRRKAREMHREIERYRSQRYDV
jgi:hypothetical protein